MNFLVSVLSAAGKNFGKGALCTAGSVAASMIIPVVIEAVKNHIDSYGNRQCRIAPVSVDDPDLC